ncbi:hypothetical protein L6164_014106 [Bauhinia variegata]|uniref:Uncharacterized protein n=1 Tax=Bauhinia variegata TaxID=167791 RepID=A0ACB9NHQ2_BAUVA|nr:hypothetical protein L6164_014106 [Bauhinia variegata]
MTAEHGSKLFSAAKNVGMMKEGYAWIVTEGLSTLLDPVDAKAKDSMGGVLGVRPLVLEFENFTRRWKSYSYAGKERTSSESPLTLFGLWAYDTVWALAMAVEKAGLTNSNSFQSQNVANNTELDFANIVWYETGPRLRDEILATNFTGVSGNVSLINGQLEPSEIEIFNVVGHTEKIIGKWSSNKLTLKEELKPPIWPGDTTERPTKMRIGVPVRKSFNEFLRVESPSPKCIEYSRENISGFAIDVFQEVHRFLPFNLSYEFCPFAKRNGDSNGTYDQLVMQIEEKNFDAVVGDVTIVANRTKYVDFTLPYSESGVSMVVRMKQDKRNNMWIFLKPLSWDMWLTTFAAFIFTGVVIWLLEHRTNPEFGGSPQQQVGIIFWFSFSTLVFAHKEKIVNNWSRLVLIVWVFVVLIITQSYTASLASMLTVQRLQPAFMDIKEIQRNNYSVGYQTGSFVEKLLTEQLGFSESKLKSYQTPQEFHEALSNGSVAAIFDEIPYLIVFLKNHGSKYHMVGPVYKTGGFGFAFPLNSPLVSDFSKAILKVIENETFQDRIQKKYFSTSEIIFDDGSASVSSDSSSLTVHSFGGLFIVTLAASLISLIFYVFKFLHSQWPALKEIHSDQGSLWVAFTEMVKRFDRKDSFARASRSNSRVFPEANPNPATDEASVNVDDTADNESTTLNQQSDVATLNEHNQMDSGINHSVPDERHSS